MPGGTKLRDHRDAQSHSRYTFESARYGSLPLIRALVIMEGSQESLSGDAALRLPPDVTSHLRDWLVSMNLLGVMAGILIGLLAGWAYIIAWKIQYTARVRQDAVLRSQAIVAGKVHEQLVPYLPAFAYNPKDVRFLGSPVDLVVFDGLAEGELRRIIFLEIKTGRAGLTVRERSVREVVRNRKVEWDELRITGPAASGVA